MKQQTLKFTGDKEENQNLNSKTEFSCLSLKELFGERNRTIASMLTIFSLLSGIWVGYKTIERLYHKGS
ncbi:MAG: hypothetical protein GIS02_06500 [Methanosarcinales archaeon]|uniref:Uncharacterized protein n=1 Tax=Candidatus Ethanoperedens thermophilum TaxID=2766897 RepID=A0A848DAP1_9EURY|nr:hypothetical protein [Candidatus Ethanoperedens thermophilum]